MKVMGSIKVEPTPTISLQSKDHEELLNIIDDLRAQGISRYIDLPQLIVCGDQSSGKSSVLEAVSGLRFPTKDNLCTRFATELILRRGGTTNNIAVTIIPDPNRSDEEKLHLQAFQPPSTALEDFAQIVEAAEKPMGIDASKKAFSKDVLRVELSGPKLPHLTLVDLPGLFHAGNKNQSVSDAEAVKAMVQSYMEKSRSIILAVVSAKNDYANQIITTYARELDPLGNRTLGIITKPDFLPAGSDSEKAFVDLAQNKDVHFRLGWHVLKNRDYNERDYTSEQRDSAEANFFSRGIWTSMPPNHVGINTLKPRLSRVLKDQILSELPGLIQDVEAGIEECRDRLRRLGDSRGTVQEQRLYLLRVSQKFSALMTAAVEGLYADAFFGSAKTAEGKQKRLRAVVVKLIDDFKKTINLKGQAKVIVNKVPGDRRGMQPFPLSLDEMVEEVRELMVSTRGCELPGTFNPLIMGELFFEQAKPWKGIVDAFTDAHIENVRIFLNLALEYTADQATQYSILANIINPAMEEVKANLDIQVAELLQPHQHGHPITFNDSFIETVQKKRDEEYQEMLKKRLQAFFGVNAEEDTRWYGKSLDIKALLESLGTRTQKDQDVFACKEVIACVESYYNTAKKSMVDEYGRSTIEKNLIRKLPTIFTPEKTIGLPDSVIESIAAETEESKAERTSSTRKLEILSNTLKILHRLDRHNPRQMKLVVKTEDEDE